MPAFSKRPADLAQSGLIAAIKLYRILLSPIMIRSCRFEPTCSGYAIEAIKAHGALKGFWYTIKRIVRCNPFSQGGFDPIQ